MRLLHWALNVGRCFVFTRASGRAGAFYADEARGGHFFLLLEEACEFWVHNTYITYVEHDGIQTYCSRHNQQHSPRRVVRYIYDLIAGTVWSGTIVHAHDTYYRVFFR